MPAIKDIYRPVADASFIEGMREYAAEYFPEVVKIVGPEYDHELSVRLISPALLTGMLTGPEGVDPVAAVEQAAPATFKSDMDDAVAAGTTYTPYAVNVKKPSLRLLIVKLNDERLVAETSGVFQGLDRFGVHPAHRRFFHNLLIGTVELDRLSAESKERLRFGLTEKAPQTISLSKGIITRGRQRQ